jgi:hypothetical protein
MNSIEASAALLRRVDSDINQRSNFMLLDKIMQCHNRLQRSTHTLHSSEEREQHQSSS